MYWNNLHKISKALEMKFKDRNELIFDKNFYEKLLQKNPGYVEAMSNLAEIYTKLGDFEKGLDMDILISKQTPNDPIVHYNLACSYSLTGKIILARDSLMKSIQLGYQDFAYILNDSDLENLRNHVEFGKIKSILIEK